MLDGSLTYMIRQSPRGAIFFFDFFITYASFPVCFVKCKAFRPFGARGFSPDRETPPAAKYSQISWTPKYLHVSGYNQEPDWRLCVDDIEVRSGTSE